MDKTKTEKRQNGSTQERTIGVKLPWKIVASKKISLK